MPRKNSLVLEIDVLCMFYSAPSDGPLVINPIKIIVNGALCAFICIPAMVMFTWFFTPATFVRIFKWLARKLICWPCDLYKYFADVLEHMRGARLFRSRRARVGNAVGKRSRVLAVDAAPSSAPEASATSSPPPSPPTVPPPAQIESGRKPPLAGSPSRRLMAPRFASQPSRPDQSPPKIRRGSSSGSSGRSGSIPSIQHVLKRVMTNMGGKSIVKTERVYSYASLNEHFLSLSLSKSIQRKDWPAVRRILLGWGLNLFTFFSMILLFSLYACEIYHFTSDADVTGQELLLSWAWSIMQRFIVNEPALILAGKGLPILFSSAFCANVCGETVANLLGLLVSALSTLLKNLTR